MFVDNIFAVINLLFLPIISFYIYLKRNKKILNFSFENLCKYLIFVIINSVFNKIVINVIKLILKITINIVSSYYTIIGIISAIFIPILIEIIVKHISITVEEKKNEEKK